MLKLGRVTKVKVLFLVLDSFLILAYSNVFEFSAAILEKGLLIFFLAAAMLPLLNSIGHASLSMGDSGLVETPRVLVLQLSQNKSTESPAWMSNLQFVILRHFWRFHNHQEKY